MIWTSKSPDGERITSEEWHGQRVTVSTRGGEALQWHGCKPGDNVFARLVKAARKHCAA